MNFFRKLQLLFSHTEGPGIYEVRFEYTNDNGHGDINPHAIRIMRISANNTTEAKARVLENWFINHKEQVRDVTVRKV